MWKFMQHFLFELPTKGRDYCDYVYSPSGQVFTGMRAPQGEAKSGPIPIKPALEGFYMA
jgi:hypothetical protein